MVRPQSLPGWMALAACLCLVAGCSTSVSNPKPPGSGGTAASTTGDAPDPAGSANGSTAPNGSATAANGGATAASATDVPIMTEVDGIDIPRIKTTAQTLKLKGVIPVDEGNAHAKNKPSTPEKGDWLIIRFPSEPKTLNPIVETSAVQSYIGEHVHEPLARLDPESLEYVPHVAERWVAEDAVKLAATYKGKERRVAFNDSPESELTVTFAASKDNRDNSLTFRALTPDGQPAPGTWVGVYPAEKILGAAVGGYHAWSDAEGNARIKGLVPGKYTVRVGAEVFGQTEKKEDGSLVVTPATPGNPLSEEIKSSGETTLTLAPGEWVDVQAQTIYTYFLRKDVKWSDGAPYTTKDILFAYAVVNNPYVDGESLQSYYEDLVACDALDEHTIRMKYRQQYFKAFEFTMGLASYAPPFHFFAKLFEADGKTLTLERLTPDEEKAANKVSAHGQTLGVRYNKDDSYNLKPMGTGPYMVDTWSRGDRVELVRNPHYWNKERAGYLDKLIFRFIADNLTAFQALRAGEIDFFWNMDAEQYHRDLAGPPEWFKEKYVKAKWYSPGFGYVGWNLLKPKFQDRRVRIALALLFDKQEFLETKLYNDAVIVSGSQYYFGPGYDHSVQPIGYDPDVARELLSAAGWIDSDNDGVLDKDGDKFKFDYLISQGASIAKERAAIFQKNLKEIGILMEIQEMEWATLSDRVRDKTFDVISQGWGVPLESDPFQIWHGSGAGAEKRGSNHISFNDPVVNELIEQLRLTLDETKRQGYHHAIHRILDREQPYMFLYLPMDHGAYHKRFRGVKWYRVRPGFDLSEWYVPKNEQVH